MPFTPVHTIITLPFVRIKPKYLSATALVLGSMAPDFEYFLTMKDYQHHGHTWLGSLYFDIPITIVAAFAFHLIVKKNLIRNLPVYFQRRFQPLLHFNFLEYFKKNYLVFILSAWLGTWSHFFLDSFTHQTGFFVRHLHYANKFLMIFGVQTPVYIVLQMTFSIVGMFVLAGYILLLKPSPSPTLNYAPDMRYWISASLVAICILALHYGLFSIHLQLNNFVVASVAAVLGSLFVCGFIRFDNSQIIAAGSV